MEALLKLSSMIYEFDHLVVIAAVMCSIMLYLIWKSKSRNHGTNHPPLPPGPRGLPLAGNLLSLDTELHSQFANLSKTYGPIITLWFGKKVAIVISSPALAREVLKVHDTTFANRDITVASKVSSYDGNDIVWSPYGDQWRKLRKILGNQMVSNETMDSYYYLRRKEIRNTVKHLFELKVGCKVNIGDLMFVTIMNVVMGMIWGGAKMGEDAGVRFGVELREVVKEITGLMAAPNMSDFYPGLGWLDLQGIRQGVKVAREKIDGIFDRVIEQRREIGCGEKKDVLEFLLNLKDNGDSKFTMTHIKALLLNMVSGGTDTTSSTIEFALAHMIDKPDILKNAQQELDITVGEGNIVEESHIKNLPYLHAIMKEVLRLHPSLPLLFPHSPSESCVIGGYLVPKGARVFVNAWAIHRDPSIWENPLEFRPERFLGHTLDYGKDEFNYFPFGSGRRICPGTMMAERMFMYLLSSLIHSFDWRLGEEEKIELSEKFRTVLRKKEPLMAIPTPRLYGTFVYE